MEAIKEHKLLILIVLFNMRLDECKTYNSLSEYLHLLNLPYEIILYNNSPQIQISQSGNEIENCIIINAEQNEKLVGPYNYAWKYAIEKQFDWIMLLDQDTLLSEDYLMKIGEQIPNVEGNIAAITPKVYSHKFQISPVILNKYTGAFGQQKEWCGTNDKIGNDSYLTAVNSGSVLRVQAISHINGFCEDFPLDFLDYWYFYEFYCMGYSVLPINASLIHELSSIASYNSMGEKRYVEYLKARGIYAKKTNLSIWITFKLRTLGQCITQLFSSSERKFFKYTFKALLIN